MSNPYAEIPQPETYTCAECGEVFPKGWSDAEAEDERDKLFWGMGPVVLVCDDCFHDSMTRAIADGLLPPDRVLQYYQDYPEKKP